MRIVLVLLLLLSEPVQAEQKHIYPLISHPGSYSLTFELPVGEYSLMVKDKVSYHMVYTGEATEEQHQLFFQTNQDNFYLMTTEPTQFSIQPSEAQDHMVLDFPPSPRVLRAVISSKINAEQQPLNSISQFGPQDTVYLSIFAADLQRGSNFGIIWHYFDDLIHSYSLISHTSYDQTWISFSLSPQEAFPPGEYKAEIYVNGVLSQEKEFVVSR